ncbi:LysR substrate-binding domain-containing protein [Marinomonas pollencensis]|uniref:LysR family transcriptional regulator n=1 Tax=Marinomonas pollencensis TaxID=491954 RepID=A0A3E0DNB4_9GAMM|nr:LysR substrate-binding domain-containing protein [Marinomonas pollencensis]REG83291.1 LysR family transcriptional regulator [Marinomonas pollencensis]
MKVDLNDYYYFVHVVEKKGYTAAARSLNMPKSRLSRHVSQLEERLGIRLLQRTSRSITVTEEGKRFFQHARKLIDTMELAEASISDYATTLSGKVTFSCSTGMAQFSLINIISDFAELHPNVIIEQRISNNTDDLISEGIDFALRGHGKELPNSSLIRRPITQIDWPFFCSPDYLKKVSQIEKPQDLAQCRFLKLGRANAKETVSLLNSEGLRIQQQTNIAMFTEDMGTLKQSAMKGLGVTTLPEYVCSNALQTGQLVRILPDWISQSANLSMLMPSRLGIPQHTRALMDFILDRLPAETIIKPHSNNSSSTY